MTDHKCSFAFTIVISTFKSCTEVYIFSGDSTSDSGARMFGDVMCTEFWSFYFTANNASLSKSGFSDQASPEKLRSALNHTLLDTHISLDSDTIAEGAIGQETKGTYGHTFSKRTILDNWCGMNHGIWHARILRNFFYNPEYIFVVVVFSSSFTFRETSILACMSEKIVLLVSYLFVGLALIYGVYVLVSQHQNSSLTQSIVLIVGHDSQGKTVSSGSGVIISADGQVLTAHHVVQRIDMTYSATLFPSHTVYTLTLLAADAKRDLALMQIQAHTNFIPVPLINVSHPLIGTAVRALGVSSTQWWSEDRTGKILQRDQSIQAFGAHTLGHLLETDIPLELGMSGVPLIDLQGDIIAINTAFSSEQWISWSTPVDQRIVSELRWFSK